MKTAVQETMRKENLRKDSLWVHTETGDIIKLLADGSAFTEALKLKNEQIIIVFPEQYKYYVPYKSRGGKV